jgi:hypothetical protein
MNVPSDVNSPSGLPADRFEAGNASPNGKIFLPIQYKGARLFGWKVPITPGPTGLLPDVHPGAPSKLSGLPIFKPEMSNISELFIKERDAFLKMKDELLGHETYQGKFVAIYEGNVVDFAENEKELAKRVYRKFGYIPIYIGKVEKEQVVGEMSSPERG